MTNQNLVLSNSLPTTTASEFPPTVDVAAIPRAPATSAAVVHWDTFNQDAEIPLPAGFDDINSFVAEREAIPAERALLANARAKLATNLAVGGIAKLRLARGWSQKKLAHALGTSQPHIARIEKGRSNLLLSTALQLADVLGVSIEEVCAALKDEPEKVRA